MICRFPGVLAVAAVVAWVAPPALAEAKATPADITGPDGIVYPDFSRAGIPGGIPEHEVVIDASTLGAIANDDQDDSAIIQAAILVASAKGGGAVLLPEGDYIIDHTIKIEKDNVVLRGADAEKTRLIPRFEGQQVSDPRKAQPVIEIMPEKVNRRYDIFPDQPIRRGDTSVHLTEDRSDKVSVGDMVVFTATPPTDVIATLPPKISKQTTDGSYGSIYAYQYLKVAKVDGQTVTFDRPIRQDVALDQNPKIMHVPSLLTGVGIENLTIAQDVDSQGITGVIMKNTYGCWMKDVTILKIGSWPLNIDRSWHYEVRDCRFDEARSSGGAVAYIGLNFACDGLFDNVRMTRLRHLSISMASNGLVFKDCFMENIDINFHLNWPNEVLFENCLVDSGLGADPEPGEKLRGSYRFGLSTPRYDGDMHVPAGPRITMYHNRITSDWDGVMLGGGATRNTIIAYNRFDVRESFAAVLKLGSADTIFRDNVFVLRSPQTRRDWMTEETYGVPDAASIDGAVFFPQGAPEGVAFTGNKFYVPAPLPMYAGGTPSVDESNETIVSDSVNGATSSARDEIAAPKPPMESLYLWQKQQQPAAR